MGIYQDIQDELKEAMKDDLLDAVAILTVTEEESSTTYNPVGGVVSSTPIVYTMNCIILDDEEENKDGEDTSVDFIELLILDSDKTVPKFKTRMKVTVRETNYEIGKIEIDPVGATHTIKCRKL